MSDEIAGEGATDQGTESASPLNIGVDPVAHAARMNEIDTRTQTTKGVGAIAAKVDEVMTKARTKVADRTDGRTAAATCPYHLGNGCCLISTTGRLRWTSSC
jgi:hypothetical protein